VADELTSTTFAGEAGLYDDGRRASSGNGREEALV